MKKYIRIYFSIFFILIAVNSYAGNDVQAYFEAPLKTMTDEQYPDNNNIGYRSQITGTYSHSNIRFSEMENGNYTISILPSNSYSDTLVLNNINILEMMPTIPDYVRSDKYLVYVALMNQEWNRIQVKFNNAYYTTSSTGKEKNILSRIDIANNCLGEGLWELLLFTKEGDKELVYFQSWFDFPKELYEQLFKKRNEVKIGMFDNMLLNYDSNISAHINLNILRSVVNEKNVSFENLNNQLYPITGERQTKAKNIIYPLTYSSINDFLTDSTAYATFAYPGMYKRTMPRATQLSRFQLLKSITYRNTISANEKNTKTFELEFAFANKENLLSTHLIIGGLQADKIPALSMDNYTKGFQRPMGISNHSFYNTYDDIVNNSSKQNPYFSFLLDDENNWLDSHNIGIDGTLLFTDEKDKTKLHVFILSFERHSFVGHFIVSIPSDNN